MAEVNSYKEHVSVCEQEVKVISRLVEEGLLSPWPGVRLISDVTHCRLASTLQFFLLPCDFR